MSDETYLESFIEHIATLPHDVRRNLELIKDLDNSCSPLVEQLRKLEQDYVQQAEEKIMQLELSKKMTDDDKNRPASGVKVLGGGGSSKTKQQQQQEEAVIPTTEELSTYCHQEEAWQQIINVRNKAMQQAEEKVAIAEQNYSIVDATVKQLDKDLNALEKLLKATGEFEATGGGAKPNDLAAIQVNPSSPDWILAKVISHDPETGMYKLSDEDVESNKIFNLPESQVVVLGLVEKLSRGDVVYAVYPDTTSFYQATVVQAPRKVGGGGSFVMVNFVDDSDEHGVTHDKAVLLQHVMRVPYGVNIQ